MMRSYRNRNVLAREGSRQMLEEALTRLPRGQHLKQFGMRASRVFMRSSQDVEADIEGPRRVGQRPDRDEIDAGFGDASHVFQRDPP